MAGRQIASFSWLHERPPADQTQPSDWTKMKQSEQEPPLPPSSYLFITEESKCFEDSKGLSTKKAAKKYASCTSILFGLYDGNDPCFVFLQPKLSKLTCPSNHTTFVEKCSPDA